eukprot:5654611-Pleurochrysis_carterae.AAC.1
MRDTDRGARIAAFSDQDEKNKFCFWGRVHRRQPSCECEGSGSWTAGMATAAWTDSEDLPKALGRTGQPACE